MSGGPGRIQRAIEAALAAEPDNAFNTQDLCERAYRGVNRVDKKHRVAVLRALRRVLARRSDLETWRGEGLGRQAIVFHRYNVTSYAMARLKTDFLEHYRSNDYRIPENCTAVTVSLFPAASKRRRPRSSLGGPKAARGGTIRTENC